MTSQKGEIKTKEITRRNKIIKQSGTYKGIIYFFESREYARNAIEFLKKLEAYKVGYIHVAYFGKSGDIKWFTRKSDKS